MKKFTFFFSSFGRVGACVFGGIITTAAFFQVGIYRPATWLIFCGYTVIVGALIKESNDLYKK